MTKLLVTMGPGLEPTDHGDIIVLDWESKRIVDHFRYAHQVYSGSHKGLTGATRLDDQVLVVSEVELLRLDLNPLRLAESSSLHFLNDVHHAVGVGDRIWVANTGLDCIEELNLDSTPIKTHHLVNRFGRQPKDVVRLLRDDLRKSYHRLRGRYDFYTHLNQRPAFRNIFKLLRENTYRRNGRELRFADFRPHVLHPNHVFPVGEDIWVTLWRTGQVVSLRRDKVLAEGFGRPHDGIVSGDRFYITDCSRNRLFVHEYDSHHSSLGRRLAERTVTNQVKDGFLRGVAVTPEAVFTGLTARRGAPSEFQTARIVCHDPTSYEVTGQWSAPTEYGRQVFSILDVTNDYA